MDDSTTLIKYPLVAIAFGTSLTSFYNLCEVDDQNIPLTKVKPRNIQFENHAENFDGVYILNSTTSEVKILKDFAEFLLSNSNSLDDETIEIINEDFFEWI